MEFFLQTRIGIKYRPTAGAQYRDREFSKWINSKALLMIYEAMYRTSQPLERKWENQGIIHKKVHRSIEFQFRNGSLLLFQIDSRWSITS
jgi:hypothetical protein